MVGTALIAWVALILTKKISPNKEKTEDQEMQQMVREDDLFKDWEGIETDEDYKNFQAKIRLTHDDPNYGDQLGIRITGMVEKSEEELSFWKRNNFYKVFQAGLVFLKIIDRRKAEENLYEIKKFSKAMLAIEQGIHSTNREAHLCLKKNLQPKEYATFSEFINKTYTQRLVGPSVRSVSSNQNEDSIAKKVWIQLKKILKVANLHKDMAKDLLILIILIQATGHISTFFDPDFYTLFAPQFVWIWFISITIPYILNMARTIYTNSFASFGSTVDANAKNFSKQKRSTIQFLIFSILWPFLPAMLLHSIEDEKEKISKEARNYLEALKENQSTETIKENLNRRKEYIKKSKKENMSVRRMETIENSCQMSLQGLMLLLYYSTTKTTTGLQSVFGEENSNKVVQVGNQFFLVMSILLSMNKTTKTILKTKKEQLGNGLMGFKSTVILGLRGFLTSAVRTMCVISFFTPFFGLWDIYKHLKVIIIF